MHLLFGIITSVEMAAVGERSLNICIKREAMMAPNSFKSLICQTKSPCCLFGRSEASLSDRLSKS